MSWGRLVLAFGVLGMVVAVPVAALASVVEGLPAVPLMLAALPAGLLLGLGIGVWLRRLNTR